MIDRRKETNEFNDSLAGIAARLAKVGVRVYDQEYDAEAFGSWHIVAGIDSKRFDFAYDGKDSYLMYRDAAVVPKDHRDFVHKRFSTWGGEDPLTFIEAVLMQELGPKDK